MKAWSIIGLLFAAAILATVPMSPQVTPRGSLELTIDKAEAYTYGRARRITRRTYRRGYRYARRSYRRAAYDGAASYLAMARALAMAGMVTAAPATVMAGTVTVVPATAMADMGTVALALDSVSASDEVIKSRGSRTNRATGAIGTSLQVQLEPVRLSSLALTIATTQTSMRLCF